MTWRRFLAVEEIKVDETLDARGLSCPMPLLRTKKALQKLLSGKILEVLSTDPGTRNDLPSWCKRTGNEYLGEKQDKGFTRFYIRKK
ncbi:sulfurtransferase TusA family protein [Thermodesulfitimonas autotrophica]|uniref:sulfurtransferase TusA family protein n=1 Tax=Thermodesulfitimonas autotrophica TaxID=1894989 RepID=UPI003FCE13DB